MSFPQTPLDLKVELKLSGVQTDISSYLSERAVVGIARGRRDETSTTEHTAASMTLDNRTARFSPRNPTGAYYGSIGRNTPIRASVPGDGTVALRIPGNPTADYASCPDTAGVSIVGDIDVRIDVTLDNWTQYQTLAVKGGFTAGTQESWQFYMRSGQLVMGWTTGGTSATSQFIGSTAAPVPAATGRLALRATLAVATGTVTFYTAPTMAGAWTALGAPVVVGATSIFDSTAAIQLGEHPNPVSSAVSIMAGKIHSFQLFAGIGGVLKASPDFTIQAAGTTSFADAQANTWTLAGDAEITGRLYRLHAEVSNWGPRSDKSGNDLTAPIQAAGILRRLGQGSSPLHSPIYRSVVRSAESLRAYWSGEETGTDASSFASGLGGPAMAISGTPTMASNNDFVGSSSLPLVANSKWSGTVPPYTASTDVYVSFMISVPSTGATNGAILARLRTTGNVPRWDLVYSTGSSGSVILRGYDTTDTQVTTDSATGPTPPGSLNGTPCIIAFKLRQVGANINPGLDIAVANSTTGTGFIAVVGTLGNVTSVLVDPSGNLNDTAIGHIAVQSTQPISPPQLSMFGGFAGETAGGRFRRLCQEEGITLRTVGDLNETTLMGPQRAAKLLDLLRECADTDQGIIYEPRDVFGLGYRTGDSLCNQTAAATLDAGAGQLAEAPEPVDDDQRVRNSITVSRSNGSYVVATLDTGRLSTLDPPNGVGLYDTQVTVNPQTDTQLIDMAGWLLHLGTVDEERFPAIAVNLAAVELSGSPTLTAAVLDADIGDLLVVTGATPTWLPADDITQLIQGSVETLGQFQWDISWNCSPGSPWRVGVTDDTTLGRADTDGSTLAAGVNTTAVTLSVSTTSGPLWTTTPAEFPFDVVIAGERTTVTNITGAASPQTFTVTRSVNGVVKAQTSGADVRLYQPMILGL